MNILLAKNPTVPATAEVLQRFRAMMASRQADDLDATLLEAEVEGAASSIEPPPLPVEGSSTLAILERHDVIRD